MNDEFENLTDNLPGTPIDRSDTGYSESFDLVQKTNGSIVPSGKPLELVTPFGQRKNKFVVQSTLNDLLNTENIKKEQNQENSDDDIIKRVQPSKRCSLQIRSSQPEVGCRFMYDRIEDKVF